MTKVKCKLCDVLTWPGCHVDRLGKVTSDVSLGATHWFVSWDEMCWVATHHL
jgi:hypothetical protein